MFFPKCKPHSGQWARYCQVKRDGIALCITGGRAYTRLPTDVTDKLDMAQFAGMLPSDTAYGELYLPGGRASDVKSDMRACSFEVWGISRYFHAPLHMIDKWCAKRGLQHAQWFDWNSSDSPSTADLPADVEGWVLKDCDKWYKVKPTPTVDCVVTGIVDGAGKYSGQVGALRVSVEGQEIARVSGMTDAARAEMGQHTLGRVCEVAYQYVGSQGRLRHPRFIRWRDDKRQEECTHDQLETA